MYRLENGYVGHPTKDWTPVQDLMVYFGGHRLRRALELWLRGVGTGGDDCGVVCFYEPEDLAEEPFYGVRFLACITSKEEELLITPYEFIEVVRCQLREYLGQTPEEKSIFDRMLANQGLVLDYPDDVTEAERVRDSEAWYWGLYEGRSGWRPTI